MQCVVPPTPQHTRMCSQHLNVKLSVEDLHQLHPSSENLVSRSQKIWYSTTTEFPFPLKGRHPGFHLTKEHEDIVHWGLLGEKSLVKSGSKRSLSRPVTREHVSQLLQGSWITNLSLLWLTLKTLSFKGESIELHSALQLLNIEWLGPACKHTCT